ncbi:sulfurtransferase [Pseudomonas sp. WN033]|nr:sulfurtransferase [Pseudomonas sp. WN033]
MKRLLGLFWLTVLTLPVNAVELGIEAREVYERVSAGDSSVLFVDVRDPVEIMFVGFTDVVHLNIPFLLVDRHTWSEERGAFAVNRNPDFVAQVGNELARRGLGPDTEIVTLCRSGSERGEPSAAVLRENGFPNARYVINGFQGSAIKEGERAGFRLLNGWQNEGLPWSAKMNPDKIFRTDLQP